MLKHLKSWSYEQLEWEVTGNVVYRRFCRIDATKVPDAKTMIRQNKLLEGPALRALFDRVVGISIEKKATQGRKMRIDTTVVEAPIRYPTDSGLLEDVVRVVYRNMRRVHDRRTTPTSHEETTHAHAHASARRQAHVSSVQTWGGGVRVGVDVISFLVARGHGRGSFLVARWGQVARRKTTRIIDKLETILPRAQQVIRQTRARIVRGVTNSSGKLISIFEPHAQILRRGKLHRPTEFGNLVKVQEAENGIITDIGGFHSGMGEQRIEEMGVHHAAIPKPGHRSKKRIAHERQRWFKRARAWRAGGEARIARLKNHFGMLRSPYKGARGTERAALWAGIANNLVVMAAQVR